MRARKSKAKHETDKISGARPRPYQKSDLSACQKIAGSSTDYAHAIDINADAIEVAEVEGQVVGFAYIQVWPWNRVAWLGEVIVDPKFRGHGIGTLLLQRMEIRARDLHCRVIMDHPPADHQVVTYYLRHGYRICGYNDSFFSDRTTPTALFVCKELEL
jgi:GNAT superfamily N-acetyltransferase